MSYVAVGVALASVAVGMFNQSQVASQQDRIAAQNIRAQGALQQQANTKTNQLIDQVQQSDAKPFQQKLLDSYNQELASKKGLTNSNLNQVGNVSSAYTKAANDAASGIANYGTSTATDLANIDAPMLQRQNEASDLSKYASSLGGIQQQSRDATGIEQMQLAGVRPNPWLSALSQAGSAFARSYAGGAGGSGGMTAGDTSYLGSGFNGATGSGNYTGNGSLSTVWPGMNKAWGT